MLIIRARVYSSLCSQVILVYFHPFCRKSFFCSKKSLKKLLKPLFLRFSVIQYHRCWHFKKLVTSFCYDKQHVCVYLQSFSRQTSQQRINNHFLERHLSLTPACAGLLELTGSGLRLLKFTFNAENFISRLS